MAIDRLSTSIQDHHESIAALRERVANGEIAEVRLVECDAFTITEGSLEGDKCQFLCPGQSGPISRTPWHYVHAIVTDAAGSIVFIERSPAL